jgi:VCBS repeat-containing protein
VTNLRDVVTNGQGTVTVAAQAPRLGLATVSTDGKLTYVPNPNANGTDNVNYTVTVNGAVSNQAVVAITITPVNDAPVSGNTTLSAVVATANTMNLIATATDPDGNADVKNAVITTWPAGLGVQPAPLNGVISFTPTTAGNFTFSYQVRDAAGLASANTGTGTVTVIGGETIAYTKNQFKAAGNQGGNASTRWTVTARIPCAATRSSPSPTRTAS